MNPYCCTKISLEGGTGMRSLNKEEDLKCEYCSQRQIRQEFVNLM